MRSNTATVLEDQTCPHCKSSDLYIEPRPPHVALVCRSCGRWVKWVSKSEVRRRRRGVTVQISEPLPPVSRSGPAEQPHLYPQVTETIRPSFDAPPPALLDRVSVLEVEIQKINRVLLFHTRILGQPLATRTAQDSFSRQITDKQISAFNRAIGNDG